MGNSQPNKIKAGRGMMDVDKVNVKMIEINILTETFNSNMQSIYFNTLIIILYCARWNT